jgi:hypothetical protein
MVEEALKRGSSKVDIRFFYGNLIYSGTALNLSKDGMSVRSQISLPVNYRFDILMRLEDSVLTVPVKIKNITGTEMDVEIVYPPKEYLEFVNALRLT